jgi:NAD kinase
VAVETGHVDAAVALFAPDAVFHSPVVHKPYVGREALHAILAAVTEVFEDFRYIASYGGHDGHVLRFAARVGDRELEGIDILSGTDGVLTELTVMVRPYSAATALRERMAALLT